MTLTTKTPNTRAILPDTIGQLVEKPITEESVTFDSRIAQTVRITTNKFRAPVVEKDAGAAWLEEGAELMLSDAEISEVECEPSKVGGLSAATNELLEDSNPDAMSIIGRGLARSIIDKIDAATFGKLPAPAPQGLESFAGVQKIDTELTNLDDIARAVMLSELEGGSLTALVTDPVTALRLSTLKTAAASNQPLLNSDATESTKQRAQGLPIISTRHVLPNTIWAIDASMLVAVLRKGTSVQASDQPLFTSDKTLIRAMGLLHG
ncbi:phage major capsid protein [Rhodococcus sp. 1139]|uniref:phage major capsid protein n=1 Tax=Rhodococcus sp. 1139 TaxID=1833762 RepID=UPI000871B756|nr:phage major capsid protein [Rhodococcus sp. 1139]OFE10766.1 hypothetical protein A5N83_00900 [Rhodococcus sp. 1139]